jgi:hypothetical protein
MTCLLLTSRVIPARVLASVRRRYANADDRGQATAEYVLVMLGAVTIATLFIAWAAGGGGGGRIGQLLNTVFDRINDLIS